MRWILTSAVLLCGLVIFQPARADAGMHFCNKTSLTVNVAMATLEGFGLARVWGWWQVEPGGCKTPIGGDLDTTGYMDYYYYGYDSSGGTWSDSSHYAFCIDPNYAFDYNDDQDNTCSTGTRRHFRHIDTSSETDYTVNLTE